VLEGLGKSRGTACIDRKIPSGISLPLFSRQDKAEEQQRPAPSPSASDGKVANRHVRDFGWEIAPGAVSRRAPIPLYTMVPRTGGYAYDVGLWGFSIIQRPFSVAPCQTLASRFATYASLQVNVRDADTCQTCEASIDDPIVITGLPFVDQVSFCRYQGFALPVT
jgi:hypothetical protein